MSRCTGHCCARFYVSVDALTDPDRLVEDGEYIADMLVPLEVPVDATKQWACTCRHFDGANCRAYDSRPRMCRNYPYGGPCAYPGCTLVQVEEPPPKAA